MDSPPQVSVIVTVFKASDHLRFCLESLLSQTLSNIEVVLVNDGSPDHRDSEIIAEFCDANGWVSVSLPVNQGTGQARRAGVEASHGEFIGFLDSDDYAHPEAFSALLAAAERHGADISIGNYGLFATDGPLEELVPPPRPSEDFVFSGDELFRRQLAKEHAPFYLRVDWWNKLYKRTLFTNFRFPHVTRNEGTASMLLSPRARNVVAVDSCLFFNRTREGSVSRTIDESKIDDTMDSLIYFCDELKRMGHFGRYRTKFVDFFFYIAFDENLKKIARLEQAEYIVLSSYLLQRIQEGVIRTLFLEYLAQEHRQKEGKVWSALRIGAPMATVKEMTARLHYMARAEGGRRTTHGPTAWLPAPTRPLVTVVTITKDLIRAKREGTFLRAVTSIGLQTYGRGNIEHIVIDGGSKDGTIAILTSLAKSGSIEFFVSEPDSGIYNAMNKGVRYARGDFLIFLNSDDYFAPTAIDELVEAILSSGTDYGFSDAVKVDAAGRAVGAHVGTIEKVYYGAPYCHQALLCSRKCYQLVRYDESYALTMWPLSMDLYLAGLSHVYLPRQLVAFSVGGLSTLTDVERFEGEQERFRSEFLMRHLGLARDDLEVITNAVRGRDNPSIKQVDAVVQRLGTDTLVQQDFLRATLTLLLDRANTKPRKARLKDTEWIKGVLADAERAAKDRQTSTAGRGKRVN